MPLQREYRIDQIGPVHLTWGKKWTKNKKGKPVKRWYIKKDTEHLIWVKWETPFQDRKETIREDNRHLYKTQWSAEPQNTLLENSELRASVEKALKSKVIWPWISATEDEDGVERRKVLRQQGYKEWQPSNVNQRNWKLLDPLTDPNTG